MVMVGVAEMDALETRLGPRVRREVAERLAAVAEKLGSPCDRLGRDDDGHLLMLMPGIDDEGARRSLQRFASAVAGTRFVVADENVRLTPAIGWTPLDGCTDHTQAVGKARDAVDEAIGHRDLRPVMYAPWMRAAPVHRRPRRLGGAVRALLSAASPVVVLLIGVAVPFLLYHAWHWLSNGYDVVQGHCVIRIGDSSWAAKLVAVEFESIYAVSHPGRTRLYGFGVFGGSNGFWRTDLLARTRMHGSMLTEDIDSTLRALNEGARITVDRTLVSQELAPTTLKALWNQRSRWAQGWLQVSLKHLWRGLRSPEFTPRQKLGLFVLLGWREVQPWLTLQMLPIIVFSGWKAGGVTELDWAVPVRAGQLQPLHLARAGHAPAPEVRAAARRSGGLPPGRADRSAGRAPRGRAELLGHRIPVQPARPPQGPLWEAAGLLPGRRPVAP